MSTTDNTVNRDINWQSIPAATMQLFSVEARLVVGADRNRYELACPANRLRDVSDWLRNVLDYQFASLIVEQEAGAWRLSYLFYAPNGEGWVDLLVRLAGESEHPPSISDLVYSADWEEREAEDLLGLRFEGHPKLGEFVLHEHWPEGINPMRKEFEAAQEAPSGRLPSEFYPPAILKAAGAMALPIGPVFSDFAESALYVIETTGEEMIRVVPRFFYKYRAVEKIVEGRTAEDALLLAERFSGTSAFAHGLAFCQAVEAAWEASVPRRAKQLRTVFAEIERLRHHASHIAAICGSTGLDVAQAQAAILEEELLRMCCTHSGHRYLFGLVCVGGLTLDFADQTLQGIARRVTDIGERLASLEKMLRFSSSFLDRIEDVGIVTGEHARTFGLVGPIARASGRPADIRALFPYAGYDANPPQVPVEQEGDGYGRLRVLFQEASESVRLVYQVTKSLADGPVRCATQPRPGAALGAVEAPIGAALHWVRLNEQGRVTRYRLATPSFRNWLAFRIAVEGLAFQDFPIILATFGLSNAECDR